MILHGRVVPRGAAQKIPAHIELKSDGTLRCFADNNIILSHHDELVVSESLGSIPRQITFANGWTFTPNGFDSDFDYWLSSFQNQSWIHKLESNWLMIACSLLITVCISIWFVIDGMPRLASKVADALPTSVNEYVGDSTIDLLEHNGFEPSHIDDIRLSQIKLMFDSLVAHYDHFSLPPKLIVRSWGEEVNAFALADGTILLTDGLIEIADSDQQIASVILHELGHVYHNHVMTQLVQASLISIVAAYLMGDVAGVGDILSSAALFGLSMSYSRHAEMEADDFAIKGMAEQFGTIDPMVEMFEKLANVSEHNMPDWLSTHPDISLRIQKIKGFEVRAVE